MTLLQKIQATTWWNNILKTREILLEFNTKITSLEAAGDTIDELGTTTNLSAAVVTASTIAASNLTAAIPAEPTKAEVDAGIDTLKTAVVAILDIKADNTDLETLRTQTEVRLDTIESKVDEIITALKTAGIIAE